MLKEAGATVLDISDMPMARMRMTGLAAAYRVQAGADIETVLHFPVRGRNLLRIQGDLLAAHALGIRNVFVTMGDPTRIGDYPQANDSHDIVPTGLVQMIKERLNTGQDGLGQPIGPAMRLLRRRRGQPHPGRLRERSEAAQKEDRLRRGLRAHPAGL